ncbi:iron uptake porin [Oscillatoria sp. FACHB-1406]|uniref:iron uptake porin n=1 Tax=Oscillatoria sp. FACHB-1406 TaxID=2692846 RepID=UPI00321FA037
MKSNQIKPFETFSTSALLVSTLLLSVSLKAAANPATPEVPSELSTPVLPQPTEVPSELSTPVLPQPTEDGNQAALNEIESYSNTEAESSLGQELQGASKFRDVRPTDWAFQALDDLIKRYDCLVGYPDGTFRGNRPLSRYEFAAGLNACLNQIERLISSSGGDFATREDLETLRRLMQEFETELASLGTRVDNLEARTAFLEDHQFSTTTKLSGEVIFALSDAWGGQTDNTHTVFQNRVRLNFLTSFTGKDQLQVRLQADNAPPLLPGNMVFNDNPNPTTTQEGRFTYDGPNPGNTPNNVFIDILRYRFPIGNKINVQIIANGGLHHYYVDTVNPYFEGLAGGSNAISRFAERNPIYRIGPFGAGAAVAIKPLDAVRVDLGYIANEAEDPGSGSGLFNGNYSAIAQVVVGNTHKIGFTYVHAYDGTTAATFPTRFALGGTGTSYANLAPAALARITGLPAARMNTPVVSNSYGIETSLPITPNIVFNGWVGLTNARLIGLGDANIWNFAGGLAFPDLGQAGNLGGLFFGAEPTLRGLRTSGNRSFSRDFAYHFEAFYRHQIGKNISITPGVIWLLNPNQNSANNDAVIGTLRTTFTF